MSRKEYLKTYREKLVAIGKCRTHPSQNVLPGKKTCELCATISKNLKEKNLRNGMCRNHKDRPIANGKTQCQECLDRAKKNQKNLIESNICVECRINKPKENNVRCLNCIKIREMYRIQKTYNLTPEEHKQLLIKQNYKCAVCDSTEKLFVDHDHKTGKIRGLLCVKHNTMLGFLNDDIETIKEIAEKLILYLKQSL